MLQRFLRDKKQVHGKNDKQVHFFSGSQLELFANLLMACVAVTVLVMPIFLLSLVNMSRAATSGVILVFVLLFATLMSLISGARPEGVLVGTCT